MVDKYEKAWMILAAVLLVAFAGTVVVSAVAQGIHPPSHVETIDPVTCRSDPRFLGIGVHDNADGGVDVVMLAQVWAFIPGEARVPAGKPVTFRLTSPDVVHGFQIVGTNVNATVIPGYITEVTTTLDRPGEYLIACNEYCGTGHHLMMGKLIVEGPTSMTTHRRLELVNILVAVAAFGIAALIAVMQAMSRADLQLPARTADLYYMSVTAHGVLMGLVFTTFFIVGFGYVMIEATVGRIVGVRLAWAGFWTMLIGTLSATAAILSGKASVLYTFYPPMQAHPAFYIGAALLIVGSWAWAVVTIRSWRAWKAENPGQPVHVGMHGMVATAILWLICTAGVAVEVVVLLIPWSLGFVERVDPVLARTLFWYFGHPLVYFWLLPAYVAWYAILPREAGGKLFSDKLTRMVFVLFVILSTPVGFHHQFVDPGIPANWKLLHTILTFGILFPSMVTAFTVVASLEVAGRMKGGKGLFGWVAKLPWGEPLFTSVILSMGVFTLGGFGGAINASFGMNAMIHNTAWVQAHFHLTVGTAVALTFMGLTYWLLPRLTGRALRFEAFARVQPWLWFGGMMFFSLANHVTGLMGMPRRVYEAGYLGAEAAKAWAPWTAVSAAGGIILFVSAMSYCLVVVGTVLWGRKLEEVPAIELAEPLEPPTGECLWDRLGTWTVVAVVLVVIAYGVPLFQLLTMERFGAPGFSPF